MDFELLKSKLSVNPIDNVTSLLPDTRLLVYSCSGSSRLPHRQAIVTSSSPQNASTRLIAILSGEANVIVFDFFTGQQYISIQFPCTYVISIYFSFCEQFIYALSADGLFRVSLVSPPYSPVLMHSAPEFNRFVSLILFHSSEYSLVSQSTTDSSISLINPFSCSSACISEASFASIPLVAVSDDQSLIAICNRDIYEISMFSTHEKKIVASSTSDMIDSSFGKIQKISFFKSSLVSRDSTDSPILLCMQDECISVIHLLPGGLLEFSRRVRDSLGRKGSVFYQNFAPSYFPNIFSFFSKEDENRKLKLNYANLEISSDSIKTILKLDISSLCFGNGSFAGVGDSLDLQWISGDERNSSNRFMLTCFSEGYSILWGWGGFPPTDKWHALVPNITAINQNITYPEQEDEFDFNQEDERNEKCTINRYKKTSENQSFNFQVPNEMEICKSEIEPNKEVDMEIVSPNSPRVPLYPFTLPLIFSLRKGKEQVRIFSEILQSGESVGKFVSFSKLRE